MKHKNATATVIEFRQEAETETSTAKTSTIPDKLSPDQFGENERSDLLGNASLDAAIAGTSGDSRDDKCELAAMDMTPRLLDEEGNREPSSLDNTPPAAAKEDVSLMRKGDTAEVLSKVAGICGDAHIER